MKKKQIFIFSLLSISFLLTSYGAISAGIPLIQAAFPNQDLSSIELLSTIPSFAVLIFVLLSSFISKKIGSKETVVLGLVLAVVSGIVPYFSNSFSLILISRFTMGIGLGLYNSLAVSLISDFFEGDLRAKLIGYQSAVQGLGSASLTFIAGKLMISGWHNMFLVYFAGIPCLILFLLFVPNPKKDTVNQEEKMEKAKVKINSAMIKYGLLLFVIMSLFMVLTLKLSTVLIEKGYGNVENGATILTLFSATSTISAFFFGFIYKKIKEFSITTSLFLMSLSFVGIFFSKNVVLTAVLVIICGFASVLLVPAIFTKIPTIVPKGSETFATSLMIVGSNVGVFISPYILKFIQYVLHLETQASLFLIVGLIFSLMGIFSLIQIQANQKVIVKGDTNDVKNI